MKSLALLILRLVTGVIFVAHGYPKIFGGKGTGDSLSKETVQTLGQPFADSMNAGGIAATGEGMAQMNLPQPKTAAWALSLAELGGGLALILGFKTRFAALALAFSQMVAINKVHKDQGLVGGYELNVSLIGATLTLAIGGPGKLSLDRG